jgi:hypothetical protein
MRGAHRWGYWKVTLVCGNEWSMIGLQRKSIFNKAKIICEQVHTEEKNTLNLNLSSTGQEAFNFPAAGPGMKRLRTMRKNAHWYRTGLGLSGEEQRNVNNGRVGTCPKPVECPSAACQSIDTGIPERRA